MTGFINIDYSGVLDFISPDEINSYKSRIAKCNELLRNKTGKGNEFLGWLNLPSETDENTLKKINDAANKLAECSKVIIVVGIGGSYLGARAVIEALSDNFHHLKPEMHGVKPLILFAGQNISGKYLKDLLPILDEKDYSVIVISKSGTTTEPAIAFRILKNHIEKKYGREKAKDRIITITDKKKGALRKISRIEGYESFIIPDDVGGRFSVLTPVGLLPVAAAGFNISELISGAKNMERIADSDEVFDNPVNLYAVLRNLLYNKGKQIEILANYNPSLNYFSEWWKQLFGESEGKEQKGIFPVSVSNTTDLHSLGQLIQEGTRNIFETVLWVENSKQIVEVPKDNDDFDGLNYLAGRDIAEINEKAMQGTTQAHLSGGVPNIKIILSGLNEFHLGQLIYFFEKACAVSGYLLGVNPFDQPGVEMYKKNMFRLLGKF
jgi:glucose-6-phosphate isomerase